MARVFFRKNAAGRKVFWIDYRDENDVRHYKSIGPNRREAVKALEAAVHKALTDWMYPPRLKPPLA